MPYAVLERKLSMVAPQFIDELSAFVDFLLYRQKETKQAVAVSKARRRKPRKLGGFEKGYWMSPDFDEPLDDFKEYM